MMNTVLYFSLCVFRTFASPDTKKGAALRVLPNRSQFFQYESVSLSCGQQGNPSEWRVNRNTSVHSNEECFSSWDGIDASHCSIDALYPSDTGVYWCESAAGECSEAASITVTAGSVILESPVLPVTAGDDVTLRCRNRTTSSSYLTTDFYKDGFLIRSSSTGNLTIHSVSTSDEGLYKCSVPGAGESPDSRLTVRASERALPVMSVPRLMWHVVVGTPYLLSTIVLGLIYRDNRRARQLVAEDGRHRVVMEVE
ncbi:low affinity immunoglobulin gamma Fc region receptor II-like isoform X2 [Siniperca chuatsi]|uniref:low affinity immunoglobulin gamma Fc region receptor II-like isoform X2 n=1 Tax=Siniperca chuatsi TaxID=119488 RepID=UPI001CE05A2A|nr:low affinity immunoglobulin gamma Fc region receptor II-like isoform X2 [Siniperca chuatsi]